jgi:hypothetical protein
MAGGGYEPTQWPTPEGIERGHGQSEGGRRGGEGIQRQARKQNTVDKKAYSSSAFICKAILLERNVIVDGPPR